MRSCAPWALVRRCKISDARIPIETYLLIREEAARVTNDPYFGLHMGEFAEAGSWSILGYMMMILRVVTYPRTLRVQFSKVVSL